MVWNLLIIVLIVAVGVSVLAYRYRSEKGIESGISSFRRELRALAPKSDEGPRPAGPAVDPPRTSGVGLLRDTPDDDGSGNGADDDADAPGVEVDPPDPERAEGDDTDTDSGDDHRGRID